MTREDLFAAIGAAEEELLALSEEEPQKKSRPWVKWAALAACIAVVVWAGTPFLSPKGSNSDAADMDVMENCGQAQDQTADGTSESMDQVSGTESGTAVTEGVTENDWGIELAATGIDATGLTLVCTQAGGTLTGELSTGSSYIVEVLENGSWLPVETVMPESEIGWDSIAYIINSDSVTKWQINWDWLYGMLPAGEYRLGKEVMNFRGPDDYDTERFYAYFAITE